jgi:hypothetical protein
LASRLLSSSGPKLSIMLCTLIPITDPQQQYQLQSAA